MKFMRLSDHPLWEGAMHENELRAHVAALLIAARHAVEAYGKASVREQKEAIDRLRRIVKNVERQLATSTETVTPPVEAKSDPVEEKDRAEEELRDDEDRARPAKSRAK
jgi:hypothetical protein